MELIQLKLYMLVIFIQICYIKKELHKIVMNQYVVEKDLKKKVTIVKKLDIGEVIEIVIYQKEHLNNL